MKKIRPPELHEAYRTRHTRKTLDMNRDAATQVARNGRSLHHFCACDLPLLTRPFQSCFRSRWSPSPLLPHGLPASGTYAESNAIGVRERGSLYIVSTATESLGGMRPCLNSQQEVLGSSCSSQFHAGVSHFQ
eukprot:4735078-Amphidinium_carterae.1